MPNRLKFKVLGHRDSIDGIALKTFILRTDNWDDFGNKIQFHLSFLDSDKVEVRLGSVKILQCDTASKDQFIIKNTTKLPKEFNLLDENHISLGQDEEYYKRLRKYLKEGAKELLEALNDIAWHPQLSDKFEPTSAFRNAMLRENGAQRARRFGASWAAGEQVNEDIAFTYKGLIEGAAEPVETNFNFDNYDLIPGRIVGIIGRNAVGKTQFLASLGADLAQISRTSADKLAEREDRFPSGRPLFTRIIAISYSAFDRFKRPKADRSSSYVYCGIRNDKGGLSRTFLMESYRSNLDRIIETGLEDEWIEYMQSILGDSSEDLVSNLRSEIDNSSETNALSLLSSGQSILVHFVTALLGWIQPNSLILFDEPETHLHPNAVASLFLVLSNILNKFDSNAVIATHSPVVIQEIPASRVMVFQRQKNLTTADELTTESFGESVTELTRHVFETFEVENVYRRTLRKLAKTEPLEEALERFEHGLSLSAEAYLLAQYAKKAKNDQ